MNTSVHAETDKVLKRNILKGLGKFKNGFWTLQSCINYGRNEGTDEPC